MALLSKGTTNAKTAKNELETYIMYLAPADTIGTHNLCPFASEGCKKVCLYSAGRGAFNNVQQARIKKTLLWANNREVFYNALHKELIKIEGKARKEGKQIAIRLNGTSDIDHLDLLKRYEGRNWIESEHLLFYDYTKNPNTIEKYLGTKYKLTFSRSECNDDKAMNVLSYGGNVAMVFGSELPETYKGYKVINGDDSDLRYFDPSNVIVGLKAKGKAKKDVSGFVIK